MKVLFIADAHLRSRKEQGYQTLMEFLGCLRGKGACGGKTERKEGDLRRGEGKISGIDDLYILGDFFDFWFSTGAFIYPEFRDVVEALAELKERGIRVHMCEGNHDFFLADYFARHLGMEVIRDWAAINLDGRRVLISHGDTVDSGNKKYLMLRRFLRSSLFYRLQRVVPLGILWRIARTCSHLSKELTEETTDVLAHKMRLFARRKFRDDFDAVILGHTHHNVVEESAVNGRNKTLALLGDWVRHYSYLCYENGRFTLTNFRP